MWTFGRVHGVRRLRADDGIRTRDPHLGKVMLYQLSHVRAPPQWRAGQTSPAETDVRSRTLADPGRRANSARAAHRGVSAGHASARAERCRVTAGTCHRLAGQPGSRTPVSLSGLRTTSMAAIRPPSTVNEMTDSTP